MVIKSIKYILILFFGISIAVAAQPRTYVQNSVNAKRVKVKQPFELRISVFTQTWFTTAPNLDNIVIPGSITIKKDRAQSTFEVVDNVRYTILYFDFIVFPVKEGKLSIPEISLKYSTPEQGDFKGKEVERKTKPLTVMVDSLEKDFNLPNWLAANNINISESWNKDLKKVKVGDVIERTITIRGTGTLAALLPATDTLVVPWGRVYYRTPVLNTQITDGVLHADRTEKISILLEKPGDYVIRGQKYYWWNPGNKKNYYKSIPERKINVEDNPDLAILKSIQDSLDAINKAEQKETNQEKPVTILGLFLWQFIILLILAFMLIILIRRLLNFIINKMNERKAAYLKSEEFFFKQLKNACGKNDLMSIRSRLFTWISGISGDTQNSGVNHFIAKYGTDETIALFNSLEKKLFGKDSSDVSFSSTEFSKELSNTRKRYMKRKERRGTEDDYKFQLNP